MTAAVKARYKKGTRVVAIVDLKGVPEGTPGKVDVNAGLTWVRYWVTFDNGVRMGTVGHEKLVRERDWDEFLIDRERLAAEAEERTAREATEKAARAEATVPADEAPADDRLAALLAKSKAAKQAKDGDGDPASTAAPDEAAPADPPAEEAVDPRLAAMIARSKKARAEKA
jgi:hypothetical protein